MCVSEHETIDVEIADGIAEVTLSRPEVLNAFDSRMQRELHELWRAFRGDDSVRCVVVTGAGDRAFCTGIDRTEALGDGPKTVGSRSTPFHFDDPGEAIGPKTTAAQRLGRRRV